MKIKLVTFAPHPNFGTCLQGYALNKKLRDMGHEVEFIYNCREVPPLTLKTLFISGVKKIAKLILPKAKIKKLKERKQHQKRNSSPYILSLPNHPILYWMIR